MSPERSVCVLVPLAFAVLNAGCRRSVGEGVADAGDFEGTVQMTIPGSNEPRTAFEIKGGEVRWSLPGTGGGSGYRVYDARARRLFTILPAQSTLGLDEVPASEAAGHTSWTFTSIAAKGQIAGYACARFSVTDGERTYEVCAAKGLPEIPLSYVLPNIASSVPFLGELEARGEVPLAVVAKDRSDAGIRVPPRPLLLAIEVRRGAIDDERFTVPKWPVTPGHASVPRALPR
jgi:hypothetical protein